VDAALLPELETLVARAFEGYIAEAAR
jgi:hypothetical protein